MQISETFLAEFEQESSRTVRRLPAAAGTKGPSQLWAERRRTPGFPRTGASRLMPYDERLAERTRAELSGWSGVEERRMFGGVAFLLRGNMCCGVTKDLLVLRLGPGGAELALSQPHTKEMDFTGKPMKGMVYVEAEGVRTEAALQRWLEQAVEFAQILREKRTVKRGKRAARKR